MRRRQFLAGAGAAAAVGLAGCGGSGDSGGDVATTDEGTTPTPGADGGTTDGPGARAGTTTESGYDGVGIKPVTVETIDARGSSAGELAIPVDGQVTVLDAFATWCAPCKPTLDKLVAAREQVGEDVRFVSVTNEQFGNGFTREDLTEWWNEHGGEWTVAHDDDGTVARRFGTTRLPTTVVTDPRGVVAWRHTGIPKTGDVVAEIERV